MQKRHIQFGHLDEAIADARALASGGYEARGQWTLPQAVNHLNKTMAISLEGTEWRLPAVVQMLMKWIYLAKVRTGDSLALRMRASAPPSLHPEEAAALEHRLDEQLAEFERLAAHIENPDTRFPEKHPVFGRISADDWRGVNRWHAAHHLSFLFPKA